MFKLEWLRQALHIGCYRPMSVKDQIGEILNSSDRQVKTSDGNVRVPPTWIGSAS